MENERVGQDTISAPIPSMRRARVIAIIEHETGTKHDLPMKPQRWVIGSNPSCDIVLRDPYVSGLHCVLQRLVDESLIIRDCDSKNGTIVDNAPIMARELRPGSVIRIGGTSFSAVGDGTGESALAQLRGSDPRFREAIALAIRAARSECSVLVVGETGTGKDLVARLIHEASRRCEGPFVAINCGAFPRELIGSELFGHVKGAFTGAIGDREGVFARSDGGTLFLDELGELQVELQPQLLRALENRKIRPVGGSHDRVIDVRFVAATNRVEGLGTKDSVIRLDLYHRVAAVTVEMPPLRSRQGDIPELTQVFLDELAEEYGPRALKPAAFDALISYRWPGNVRELKQTIHRAVALTQGEIDAADLALPSATKRGASTPLRRMPSHRGDEAARAERLANERDVLAYALERGGSVRAAARKLNMAKSTFADRAHKLGLQIERQQRDDGDE